MISHSFFRPFLLRISWHLLSTDKCQTRPTMNICPRQFRTEGEELREDVTNPHCKDTRNCLFLRQAGRRALTSPPGPVPHAFSFLSFLFVFFFTSLLFCVSLLLEHPLQIADGTSASVYCLLTELGCVKKAASRRKVRTGFVPPT